MTLAYNLEEEQKTQPTLKGYWIKINTRCECFNRLPEQQQKPFEANEKQEIKF